MEEEEDGAADRISQLPDAILQHILSFILIKQAVQTTILSTRWHNLWLSISDLDFNFTRLAVHGGAALGSWQGRQDFSHHFQQFVSGFLAHRDGAATVRKFHLSLDGRDQEHAAAPLVEKCLHYAITHGVEDIHLHKLSCRPLRFPDVFFASKTLRKLKLTHLCYGIYLPKQFSLPHLNTLHLETSFFINDGETDEFYSYTKEPFSGFPELEKLTLERCRIHELVIHGPKLRILEIIQTSLSDDRLEEIRAPMLTSFRYESYLPLQCSKLNFPVLEETYLNILRYHRHQAKWMTLKCVEMLQHFGNVKVVTLTLDTIKVLEMDGRLIEQTPCPFPNMRCLKLMEAGRRDIPTVQQRVMNYLIGSVCGTGDESLRVEFPEGVSVIEEDYFDELQLEQLFEIQDEI